MRCAVIVLLCCVLAGTARADPLQAGIAAYGSGAYAAAMSDWLQIAQPSAGHPGDPAAQANIALLYELGQGVARNYTAAWHWDGLAFAQGDSDAASQIGWMYLQGWGVKPDPGKAAAYSLTGAKGGDMYGQNNLGMMFDNGISMPVDHAQAAKWYLLAAKQGYALAQDNLANDYYQSATTLFMPSSKLGTGTPRQPRSKISTPKYSLGSCIIWGKAPPLILRCQRSSWLQLRQPAMRGQRRILVPPSVTARWRRKT